MRREEEEERGGRGERKGGREGEVHYYSIWSARNSGVCTQHESQRKEGQEEYHSH